MKDFFKEWAKELKQDIENLKNSWFFGRLFFMKRILIMYITFQPRSVIYLEKGAYYLRRGAKLQVGQPVRLPMPGSKKLRTRYITNLFFNFKLNSITASYQDKPIKGLSEKFNEKKG